ncbi:hypothetical protein O3M35_010242 [Rhynocoris fuscipes]|uniref:C2H2-type domain-containing protein n=1 Tax=Rhynocoris fuscipes TaxID=488301 RepID=A0AAW1D5X4_9HEMI
MNDKSDLSSDELGGVTKVVKTYGNKKFSSKNSLKVQESKKITEEETTDKDVKSSIVNGDDNSNKKRTLLKKQLVPDGKVLGCLFCGVCEFQTNIPSFMTAHMKKHRRKKNVICEKCFRRFKKGIELVNHVRSAHRRIQYLCSACNFVTNEQSVLRDHCISHKDISLSKISIEKTIITVPNNKCTICDYEFIDKLLLQQHMKLHYTFVCSLCGNRFEKPEDMKRVENTDNGLFQFQCKCTNKYTLTSPVKGKMQISDGQRPFHCSVCPCKFKNANILSAHMKSHLEKTAYKCNHCSNTFRMLAHLESHMRAHRNNPS